MTEDEVNGLFTLAGLEVLGSWRLVNRYYGGAVRTEEVVLPRVYEEGKTLLDRETLDFLNMALPTLRDPWWLVKTKFGLIEVGWRKRVIQIDWRDTGLRCVVTADEVTKDEHLVHAWNRAKAVKYLDELRVKLEREKQTS